MTLSKSRTAWDFNPDTCNIRLLIRNIHKFSVLCGPFLPHYFIYFLIMSSWCSVMLINTLTDIIHCLASAGISFRFQFQILTFMSCVHQKLDKYFKNSLKQTNYFHKFKSSCTFSALIVNNETLKGDRSKAEASCPKYASVNRLKLDKSDKRQH